MKIVGFDIGGANTDFALVEFEKDKIKRIDVDFEYLPVWKEKEKLKDTIKGFLEKESKIDGIGVTMTAELSDAYKNKKEGVLDILNIVENVSNAPTGYISFSGILTPNEAKKDPIKVASANWVATAELVGRIVEDCILVDIGSTTTDIIPIRNGSEAARGKYDIERLNTGELVYTGMLRTNVATIVDRVPIDDKWYRVSSELFAITADVHLILGNIDKKDYVCDTPDGRGKTKKDAMRRIAKVVCADMDILSKKDILSICKYIADRQVLQVSDAISEVVSRERLNLIVTTGLGMELAEKACDVLGIENIRLDKFFSEEECTVMPAIGSAIMMSKHLNTKHP